MGISIKHDEIERAIRELARRKGTSLTDAIGEAVRNELAREGAAVPEESLMDRIRRAQAIVAAAPVLDDRSPDELIGYDEYGVPA